ncbi:MAG: sarcosine oxidase subunit gamma [Pseudomonadota bacterium]
MSDYSSDMQPITPLGGHAPRVDDHGPVSLREVTDTALASFAYRQGREADALQVLGRFVSMDPLPAPGKGASNETYTVLWTGPDQFMVLAPHDSTEDLAAQLKTAAGDSASVTEQNDAWCRFDLTGSGLAEVFERLCPVNLRAGAVGEATRTTIDHLGCLMFVQSDAHITVLGPRSSAGSLHHALLTAMRSAH